MKTFTLLLFLSSISYADCAVCCGSISWGSQQGSITLIGTNGNPVTNTNCYIGTDPNHPTNQINTCNPGCAICICNIPTCASWTGSLNCPSPNGAGNPGNCGCSE